MPYKTAVRGSIFLIVLLFVGTVFYVTVEGLSPLDAFYLSGLTVTTLGFGDIIPTTVLGKIFTVFYALVGISAILYVSSNILHTVKKSKKKRRR